MFKLIAGHSLSNHTNTVERYSFWHWAMATPEQFKVKLELMEGGDPRVVGKLFSHAMRAGEMNCSPSTPASDKFDTQPTMATWAVGG